MTTLQQNIKMCIYDSCYTNEATKYEFVLIWVSTQIKSWLSWTRFSIIFHTFSVWVSGWYYLLTSCQLASHDCTHISFEIWGTMAVNDVWDMMLCSVVDRYQCFRRTCCLCLQSRRWYSKYRWNRFLWKLATYLPNYMVTYSRRPW